MARAEFCRAFLWNRWLGIAILIGWIGAALRLPEYLQGWRQAQAHRLIRHPAEYNVHHGFLSVYGSGLYPLLAPLLAALPYADALALDRATHYRRWIHLRTTRRRYLLARLAAAALAGGFAVAAPPALLYGLLHLFLPRGLPPPEFANPPRIYGPLGDRFGVAPDLYIAFLIGLAFTFGMAWAVVGLAIGAWTERRYLAQVLPAALALLLWVGMALLRLETWAPTVTLFPSGLTGVTGGKILVAQGGVGLIGLVALIIGEQRNREA